LGEEKRWKKSVEAECYRLVRETWGWQSSEFSDPSVGAWSRWGGAGGNTSGHWNGRRRGQCAI